MNKMYESNIYKYMIKQSDLTEWHAVKTVTEKQRNAPGIFCCY